MGVRELEKLIHEEIKKEGLKLPGSVEKWEYHPMIQRIARAAYGYVEDRKMDKVVFRDIAGKWYQQAKKDGFFRNDFKEDRKREHSFYSFAYHLDNYWAIGVAPRSPWAKMIQLYRKVKYKIKKLLK